MSSPQERGINFREIGKAVAEFLLEPITFTKLLRERLGGKFVAEQMAPVGFSIVIGISAALNFSPVVGVCAGIVTWLLTAGALHQIRSRE